MQVECVPAAQVVESDWKSWDALRSHTPALSSPYFSAAFCRVVSTCSSDLFVARISDNQGLAGFFPFHRSRWATGWPLAKGLSGYHGIIGPPELVIDVVALLKQCKLKTFDFSSLPATQTAFLPFSHGMHASHAIDLRAGFDDYAARLRRSSSIITATWRQRRRAEREVGRVRLELHVGDLSAFQTLIRLKAAQYRKTGVRNILANPGTLDILRAVLHAQQPELSGILSVLYIGDQVAALLFGMRSHGTLHCWLSAYDPRFVRYSPGIMALVELAHRAPASGIEVIDLGTGAQAYKVRLATEAVKVLWGRIERPSLAAVWRAARRNVRRLVGHLGS